MPPTLLAPVYGGPAPVTAMCLELALAGFAEEPNTLADLDWILDMLGIDRLTESCDVGMAVDITGVRTSSVYTRDIGGGSVVCWTGHDVSGGLTLTVSGVDRDEWPVAKSMEPPDRTSWCPEETEPLDDNLWVNPLVLALTDAFGVQAALFTLARIPIYVLDEDDSRVPLLESVDGAGILAAALGSGEADVRRMAADDLNAWVYWLWVNDEPYPPEMWATIPYLIAYGAVTGFEEEGGFDARDALSQMLFDVRADGAVGTPGDDPAGWWALWEQRPTPEG